MAYYAMYKCRLCGEVYKSGTVAGNRNLAINATIGLIIGKNIIPQSPTLIDIHYCENDSIGCADFVGWKVGEDND